MEITWHAYSERSTADGNLLRQPNQPTRMSVVERANAKTDEELYRLCQIADYADIFKIGELLQTRPARNSAGLLSIPCVEVDRPTSVEGGQLLRRIRSKSTIGPIKEINVFNKEGSAGTDVRVPSTSNPEILTWFNACTEEVQNCRQIAAISRVILTGNQSNETSKGSGKPCSTECHIDSQGKP